MIQTFKIMSGGDKVKKETWFTQLIQVRPPSILIHTAKKVEKVVAELFIQRLF